MLITFDIGSASRELNEPRDANCENAASATCLQLWIGECETGMIGCGDRLDLGRRRTGLG